MVMEKRAEQEEANWAAIAAEAGPKLATLRRGERDEGLRQLAASLNLSPQFIRRAVAALSFVERVDFDVNLRLYPLAGVETIRRWYRYDSEGASEAARRLANREYISTLEQDERAARDRANTVRSFTRIKGIEYTKYVATVLIGSNRRSFRTKTKRLSRYDPDYDLLITGTESDPTYSAAVIIGPDRALSHTVTRDLIKTLTHALGLSYFYGEMFVIFSNESTLNECSKWLQSYGVDRFITLRHIPIPDNLISSR